MAAAFVSLTSGDDSFSVTVPAGSDRLLVAIVYGSNTSTGRSATYGGVAMDVANNANEWCQMFYMLDPPEGAATLAITGGTGAGTISQTVAAHYTGVGSFQEGSQASAASASFDPDGAGLIVFGLSSESASHAPVADTNERLDDPNDWLGDRIVASAGTVTVGASAATNPDHAAAIFLEPETSANVSGTVELAAVTTAGAVADGSADISGAVTLASVETSGSVTPVGGPLDITGDVVLGAVQTSGRVAFGLVTDTGDEDIPLQSGARRFVGVVEVSAFTNKTTLKPNAVDNDALAQMPANTIKANPTGVLANAQDWLIGASRVVMRAAGNLIAGTITEVLDLLGATRGSLPLRGAATWGLLTPGTTDLPLTSKGAGADPVYQQVVTAGIANNAVTNAKAAQMAANTVKANATASLADAQDLAVGLNSMVARIEGDVVSHALSTLAGNGLDYVSGVLRVTSDTASHIDVGANDIKFSKAHRRHFFFEDFDFIASQEIAATSPIAITFGGTQWALQAGVSPADIAPDTGAASHMGILIITTGASDNSGLSMTRGSSDSIATPWLVASDVGRIRLIMRMPVVTSAFFRFGFFSDITSPANAITFEFDTDLDTTIHAICTEGGVPTDVDTGVAPGANAWNVYEIRQTTPGTVEFFIDDALVATISTNVPDAETGTIGLRVLTRTTAARQFSVDYFDFESAAMTRTA